ncbi:SDR family NAD(P)-dependent oxidoreductase [Aestuariivivens sp. NBU2969]|uniref:SDR family NAD(P)-dependent oxidoreductase n=1 Tax=Aestuariivivens sp. NBU2969 TaxID=2873267 RepID=UPI001CBEC3AD|nr:SDR family oxidoreductase [Aestuariivivens sp. NBU2969]
MEAIEKTKNTVQNRLQNKKVIVTGAGNGIGRGLAEAMGMHGAKVAICATNPKTLSETEEILKNSNIEVFSKVVDIRIEDEIIDFVKESVAFMGGINVLINNAAVMPSTRLETLTSETIDHVLSVNLRAPILFTREVVPYMKEEGVGSIIHMSSVTGHNGFPEVAIYGATKGGLNSLARGHAMELAPYNIRVNSISPGTVDSPMLHRFVQENSSNPEKALLEFSRIHPRGTVASVEEVANTFVFLASDESANITATDIRCDGGYCVQGVQPK